MLCGVRATDYSMASCTLLFDQRQPNWSEEILACPASTARLLPDAAQRHGAGRSVTAAAARDRTAQPGTPVVLGGHDHLCGALPVGAFRPGVVLNVIGTWEIVLASIPAPVLTPRRSGPA